MRQENTYLLWQWNFEGRWHCSLTCLIKNHHGTIVYYWSNQKRCRGNSQSHLKPLTHTHARTHTRVPKGWTWLRNEYHPELWAVIWPLPPTTSRVKDKKWLIGWVLTPFLSKVNLTSETQGIQMIRIRRGKKYITKSHRGVVEVGRSGGDPETVHRLLSEMC